ncbi:MAG: TonB-dependent receptor [Myxococcales bacterium]|nr:TonB-dependent receptor [Myxococcales bacterium]
MIACLATATWAQEAPAETAELSGVVLERGSGARLAGASVVARSTVGDGEVATSTADDGTFRLEVPAGPLQIVVTATDHREQVFDEALATGESVEVRYYVDRYAWDDEIVVYGEMREEVAREVLSAEELRRVPGAFGDPIRALQSLPSVSRGPDLSGDIVARGAEAWNTAAYVDGIRVPFLFHFLVGRSIVNPDLLDDIEFYPGAVPPRFGDVSQAVIQARTDHGVADPGLHGRVHFDLLDYGGSLAANLDHDWTLRMAGRKAWVSTLIQGIAWGARVAQGLEDPAVREASIRFPYEDYQARLERDYGRDVLSFTWIGARDGIGLIPERPDADGDGHPDPPPPNLLPYDPDALIDTRFFRIAARWDHDPGTLDGSWSTWAIFGRDIQQNLVPDLGLVGATSLQFARLETWWLSLGHDGRFDLSRAFELRYGADLIAQPGRALAVLELSTDPEHATTTATKVFAGPFAEVVTNAGPLRLAPGLRVSVHHLLDQTSLVPEPRLNSRLHLSDSVDLIAYAGLLSQGPGLAQVAQGFAGDDLSVTRAAQFTMGLEGRWPSGLGLTLAAYETEMWDLVVRDDRWVVAPGSALDTGPVFLQEVPRWLSAHGRSAGVELQLRSQPVGDRFGWIASSVGRSLRWTDDFDYRAQSDIPFNLVAVYGFSLGHQWTMSGRGQLASGLVFTPQEPSFRPLSDHWEGLEGPRNADRYPVYRRVDLRIDKSWIAKRARWTVYLDVFNATNAHNPLYTTYDDLYLEPNVLAFVPILPTLGIEAAY